jgi:cellulose biosynthesis protein BcsQ
MILVDLGPNLGAINRSALIASDYVVTPLGPDLFSVQGLRNLGPALRRWRTEWTDRRQRNPAQDLDLPEGKIEPIGYVILQHSVRLDRPVQAYDRWINRIPGVYRQSVLGQNDTSPVAVANDTNCIAQLKHYRSLMPMAQEARKPIFFLKPADGAMGAHTDAVKKAYDDFHSLAGTIAGRIGIKMD